MNSTEIRNTFFKFFESKDHKIVPSAPIVNKQDPTLMFTNAGMNQFKDYFLGNKVPEVRRLADTQKCLRVSGKHNDLEEVGIDSYHHTMFEMLGNWSIGDYFKAEAIEWAWELLTEVYGLPKDRLYASVFEGDESEGLERDDEAAGHWKKFVPEDRILYFDKRDNFWEMGEQGPCGPCSEIHIDLRSNEERSKVPGKDLVNADHPLVVEIWNLVFIQFNRKADGSLENLPEKHVDTGMGFERLCMALQQKQSNYATDIFMQFINQLEDELNIKYTADYSGDNKKDIAFRVIVDHIRAVSFTIADGELPSNTGAGYVIRRILRRAVRYSYTFLDRKEPLLHTLVPGLAGYFKEVFPELEAQKDFVAKIILEEEKSFLRTLAGGLKRLDHLIKKGTEIDGNSAFELYDTYGFPIDLTRLIASENGLSVNEKQFEKALTEQKERSRADAQKEAGDWEEVNDAQVVFIGYDHLESSSSKIIKYRTVTAKGKEQYHLVLDKTPFYGESGGQVGDTGEIQCGDQIIKVYDTQKENDLIIHYINELPKVFSGNCKPQVHAKRRGLIQNNHTATHLLHAALRQVLGDHVAQKGSLVNDKYLRFDFSHFEKISESDLSEIEKIVNTKIRENISLGEARNIPIEEAKSSGAMMLFGEKYGDFVRMITFDPSYSVELCGGCHVEATGSIGMFKIKSESAIAAGVRRIEALTSIGAEMYVNDQIAILDELKSLFKNPTDPVRNVSELIGQNKSLQKELEELKAASAGNLQKDLVSAFENRKGINVLAKKLTGVDSKSAKTIAYNLEKQVGDAVILFGLDNGDKANLMLTISQNIVSETLDAGKIIKSISSYIQGGGGGQSFFATAGGKNASGIDDAILALKEFV
jgi:alanyl-tRNA synthetase